MSPTTKTETDQPIVREGRWWVVKLTGKKYSSSSQAMAAHRKAAAS